MADFSHGTSPAPRAAIAIAVTVALLAAAWAVLGEGAYLWVKAAHVVRIGDRVSLNLEGLTAEFDVLGLPARRGPAPEARTNYAETPASTERRAKLREQHRLAELSRPRPDTRPDKRERRRLVKFQRGD